MVACGDKISRKKQALSAARNDYRLDVFVVSRNSDDGHARQNLRISREELPLPGFRDGSPVRTHVTRAVALRGLHGVLEFCALHNVSGIREGRNDSAVIRACISPRVVEV